MKSADRYFIVCFRNENETLKLSAKTVQNSELFGFLEVSHLIFQDGRKFIIEPSDDKMRREFRGVNRTLIPIQSVIRIDEMEGDKVVASPFLRVEEGKESEAAATVLTESLPEKSRKKD